MYRLLLSTLSLALAVAAQDGYEALIEEALRLERELRVGDTPDMPLERAYLKLGEAAGLAPGRWEAFALRGTNRCTKAVICRTRLVHLLAEARARGDSAAVVRNKEDAGRYYVEQCIEAARHDFQVMHRNMRRRGEVDPDRLKFALAAVKYAEGRYLKSKQGVPGAIDEFKELVERKWNVDHCSEFIARCYLELGVMAVQNDDFVQGHAFWDTALEWSRSDATTRVLLSNKAAAYDREAEFGYAEEIVRKQLEMEPKHPVHWKNLGLMLGHQNKLRAALRAYARARELCQAVESDVPLGYFHGNAWLKAAMIHGKLLEEDGDLRLAWRLFLEYRAMLGDDYNFCVNFGEFAFHQKQYDLSWTYLTRARDLMPFCVVPHQLLLMTAQRLEGPDEEVERRIEEARAAFREARKHYKPREESSGLKRLCGGLRDRPAGEVTAEREYVDPDPLAGFGLDDPPPDWLVAAAAQRVPFDPDRLDAVEPPAPEAEPEPAPEPVPSRSRPLVWIVLIAVVLLLALALLMPRRKARRT